MSPDRPDGPVTAATADLVAWLHDATGTEVNVGPPRSIEDTASTITAWPLELRPDQEARGTGPRMPMRLVLRSLVCASGAGEAGVRLLDRALVAAAADAGRVVVLDPPTAQTWLAFGVAPRPALLFDTPLQIARTTPAAPLIRHPMQVQTMAMLAVHGRVLGPGDVPLADMRVEVAGLRDRFGQEFSYCFF